MYTSPHQLEPVLPRERSPVLSELAVELVRRSGALGSLLHPITRVAVAELLRRMNSYYSNLIEGHHTHPVAIERALRADYAREPRKRALQRESAAHVEVQRLVEKRLLDEPELDITSADFLCWMHRAFYERLPPEFRVVEGPGGERAEVVPGELRAREVGVGRHVAPAHASIPAFLKRFSEAYRPSRLGSVERIVAAAASHHRLAWIHPFLDGNGRVARLFSHAYFVRAQVDGHGLWMISRGLARRRDDYVTALANADHPRLGDLDGRGTLSDRMLAEFCEFFLRTALDQVDFMSSLLELDQLQNRLEGYVAQRAAAKELRPESVHLLRDVLLRGEVARGESARISGLSERVARDLVGDLLRDELLTSPSPKGPLRLGLPAKAVGYWFPRLYPEGVEESMKAGRE